MGFMVKSAFWLGLVYSAMPFEPQKTEATQPLAAVSPAEPSDVLKPYSEAVSAAWRERDSLETLVKVAAAELCGRGCPLPPSRPKPGG
jgi:hypothetical protein